MTETTTAVDGSADVRAVGVLTGMYAVAQWLASRTTAPGFDPTTSGALAAGAHAMVVAASSRLGVNPDGTDATDWPVGDEAAREARRHAEQIRIDGGMS